MTALLANPDVLAKVEGALRTVPGHGSGARLSYLWMLAGDDQHIKPDRMVLRWLSNHLGRDVGVPEARALMPQVQPSWTYAPGNLITRSGAGHQADHERPESPRAIDGQGQHERTLMPN
ncbi:MAG: hypothetical protein ACRDTT_00695 [Pseudonocardiaceae bacterium]